MEGAPKVDFAEALGHRLSAIRVAYNYMSFPNQLVTGAQLAMIACAGLTELVNSVALKLYYSGVNGAFPNGWEKVAEELNATDSVVNGPDRGFQTAVVQALHAKMAFPVTLLVLDVARRAAENSVGVVRTLLSGVATPVVFSPPVQEAEVKDLPTNLEEGDTVYIPVNKGDDK